MRFVSGAQRGAEFNTMAKGKKRKSSADSSSSMESSQTKLERLRVVREGHRRYVSKLDKEVTEILCKHHVESRDYERLDVIWQLLDGKQRSLSEIDQTRCPVF